MFKAKTDRPREFGYLDSIELPQRSAPQPMSAEPQSRTNQFWWNVAIGVTTYSIAHTSIASLAAYFNDYAHPLQTGMLSLTAAGLCAGLGGACGVGIVSALSRGQYVGSGGLVAYLGCPVGWAAGTALPFIWGPK